MISCLRDAVSNGNNMLVWYLIPDFLIELLAKTAGYIARALKTDREIRIEGLIRGWFWGKRFGCKKLFVGRHVVLEGINNFKVGNNVRLNHGVHISTGTGYFEIGDNSHLARQSVVGASGGVRIGENCAISSHVAIYSVTNQGDGITAAEILPRKFDEIIIDDGVFIGAGAVILSGVTLGENAVVAAGAMVREDVPSGQIHAGIPASQIRKKSARQTKVGK